MKIRYNIVLTTLIATVLTSACSEDVSTDSYRGEKKLSFEFRTKTPGFNVTRSTGNQYSSVELKDSHGDSLRLSVSVSDGISLCQKSADIDQIASYAPATRGSVITTDNITTVGMTAYDHTTSFSTTTVTVATNGFGFANVQFDVDADKVATPTSTKYWPTSDHKMSFFAYAPASVVNVAQTTGYPSFNYTVTTTLTDQKDLLVSKLIDQDNSVETDGVVGRCSMALDHALSAILFTFGDIGISEGNVVVTLSGLNSAGTFSYETMSWSGQNTSRDYSTLSHNAAPGVYSQINGGGNNIMFLMPQTIPDNATINVRYVDSSGNQHIYTDKLKHIGGIDEWKAGKTYTYTIGTTTAKVTNMYVSYPAGWSDVSTSNNVDGPITQYESNESFGLFAVNLDGKIVISNEQVTIPTTGSSNIAMPLKSTTFYSSDYIYYLMYPYDSNVTTTYPQLAIHQSSPGNTAEQFFACVINGWTVPTNQNTSLSDLKALDLQVGAMTEIGSASRSFSMKHTMGLAILDMTTGKTVPDTRTYTFTGGTNSTYADSEGHTTIYPVHNFKTTSGYVLPLNATTADADCYYMVKPTAVNANTSVKVGCATAESQNRDYWSDKTISDIGYGKCKTIMITSDRECINFVGLFPYAGQYQQVTLPWTGSYKMECWGGGQAADFIRYYQDKCCGGGYVKGCVSFDRGMVLFVYVGGGGTSSSSYAFNGGGPSSPLRPTRNGGGGTDIRTTKHTSSNGWGGSGDASLRSRIIVAGGGAYTSYDSDGTYKSQGGCAGGLNGHDGQDGTYYSYCGKGGTQTGGGASPASFGGHERGGAGQFGYGGAGKESGQNGGGSGGGGGWYGGSGASGAGGGSFGAGGGSSFISGHPGCNGVDKNGNHQGAGNPSKVLYQGTGDEHTITFTSTVMIDGAGHAWTSTTHQSTYTQMPIPSGGYYDSGFGHPGNGYAKITSE